MPTSPDLDVAALIDNLRARVPWHLMKKVLESQNFRKGHGWGDTKLRLLELCESGGRDDRQSMIKALYSTYLAHLRFGNKTVSVYELDDDQVAVLSSVMQETQVSESGFSEFYPFKAPREELPTLAFGPAVVAIDGTEDDASVTTMVLASKRTVRVRETIEPGEGASEDLIKLAQDSVELVAFRDEEHQFLDMVALDRDKSLLEVRIDASNKLASDSRAAAAQHVEGFFEKLVTEHIGETFSLPKPINLFPAIDRLYRSTDGRVVQLAFTTDEGSVKNERMRRLRRVPDLRVERFHHGGAAAVNGEISPYKIAATWEVELDSGIVTSPELMISGNVGMLSIASPSLSEASITNALDGHDYSFVVEKLLLFARDEDANP